MKEAIFKGGEIRLKLVLMTAFTTTFSLISMLIAPDPGSEIQKPLRL